MGSKGEVLKKKRDEELVEEEEGRERETAYLMSSTHLNLLGHCEVMNVCWQKAVLSMSFQVVLL